MDEAAVIRGVSHVSLSVRDLERSLRFYRDVLGLPVLRQPYDGVVFDGRQTMLVAGRIVITLQAHAGGDGGEFEPTRPGLDHLAFHVSDRHGLRQWVDRLDDAGVPHSGVKEVEGWGWMIELRDPDGIQLEVFTTR